MGKITISRRTMLQSTAASFTLFACSEKIAGAEEAPSAPPESHDLGVYLTIDEAGQVTFTTPNAEMGQGTFDALARMIAEELDADWASLKITLSGANKAMFNPRVYGQTTGNSVAIRGFGPVVRQAGAAARHMLRQAAANRLAIPFEETKTRDSVVYAGDTELPYGSLVSDAAALPIPKNVPLKAPEDFRLIGKPFKRKETGPKISGEAVFGIDVERPNMLVAALAMPPQAWGEILEPAGLQEARAQEGVEAITRVTGGYAVIAEDFWTAKTVADSLQVKADLSDDQRLSSADMDKAVRTAVLSPDAPAALYSAAEEGQDLASSRAAIGKTIDAAPARTSFLYSVPILAHGALEPLNATALVKDGLVEMWVPTQNPATTVKAAAEAAGVDAEAVTVHRTFIGGGFGRKWNVDFVTQAVEAAMAMPGRPVKLIWTREQDTQHDFYRPIVYGALEFGLDGDGYITAISSATAGQSLSKTWFARYNPDAPDTSLQNDPAYAFASTHVESRAVDLPLPMGWWRSVSHMPTVFFLETAMDELAQKVGEDAFDYRVAHLKDDRAIAVLKALRAQIKGQSTGAIGIAYSDAYDGHVAAAVDVSIEDNQLIIHKIWAVADVGLAVDPQNVKRQISGGLYFGLGPALDGDMKLEDGAVTGSNLNDIGALTPYGAPPVEVTLIDNPAADPAGVGEIGTPLIAPALCNAIVAAGGPRIRSLPVSRSSLSVQV